MTIGQLAALIAAVAFAALVVFIILNLKKFAEILELLKDTVLRLNNTIEVVTKDADHLSVEVEGLLNKTNLLVDDINGKVKKTDPLFTAIGDVGTSVSDLNTSTKHFASNLVGGLNKKTKRSFSPKTGLNRKLSRERRTTSKMSTPSLDVSYTPVKAEPEDIVAFTSTLSEFTDRKPSTTAGEITIQKKEQ